jgi:hypothetical protein
MPKSFYRKAFDQWLSSNRKLFRHSPVIVKSRKKYFTMRFHGINSAIGCIITSYDYSISVDYKGECWDLIDEEYVCEQRTPSGQYFCEACEPESRKLFSTRFALWEDHIFKPILNWASNNLLKTKWLCLFQCEGSTMAKVVDKNSLLMVMQDDSFVKVIPLMENQVMPIQKSATMKNNNSDSAMRQVTAFKKLIGSLKKLEPE